MPDLADRAERKDTSGHIKPAFSDEGKDVTFVLRHGMHSQKNRATLRHSAILNGHQTSPCNNAEAETHSPLSYPQYITLFWGVNQVEVWRAHSQKKCSHVFDVTYTNITSKPHVYTKLSQTFNRIFIGANMYHSVSRLLMSDNRIVFKQNI